MFPFKKSKLAPAGGQNRPTDGQLLQLAAAGDQTAFADLYQRYAGRLYGYLLSRCAADADLAEDLRQQVFLQLLESKAFEAAKRGMARADLSSLLFTIAANLLKNNYRTIERRQRREDVYQQLRGSEVEVFDAPIDPQELECALAKLPEEQRLCIQLRFRRGMSIKEIASLTGTSTGTVKSRLHYGLLKLRQLLADALKN